MPNPTTAISPEPFLSVRLIVPMCCFAPPTIAGMLHHFALRFLASRSFVAPRSGVDDQGVFCELPIMRLMKNRKLGALLKPSMPHRPVPCRSPRSQKPQPTNQAMQMKPNRPPPANIVRRENKMEKKKREGRRCETSLWDYHSSSILTAISVPLARCR